MHGREHDGPIGVLLSGGLDSAILLGDLLRAGRRVQPFYVCCGLVWEEAERRAAESFLAAVRNTRLDPLVVLDMPVGDLYGDHWSTLGRGTPGSASPDDAVYLPGRNPLLLVKPLVWCAAHGIDGLALAVLNSNPFADATPDFFAAFASAMALATGHPVEVARPFESLSKKEVMRLGGGLPLELTFSCIAPKNGKHCGQCNKCAERAAAFQLAGLRDPTSYADGPPSEAVDRGQGPR